MSYTANKKPKKKKNVGKAKKKNERERERKTDRCISERVCVHIPLARETNSNSGGRVHMYAYVCALAHAVLSFDSTDSHRC